MFESQYQVVFKANSNPGDNTCTEWRRTQWIQLPFRKFCEVMPMISVFFTILTSSSKTGLLSYQEFRIFPRKQNYLLKTELSLCIFFHNFRSTRQRCSVRKGILRFNFIKKRLWYRCFPVNFRKFLRTPFLQNTSGRLLF